MSRRNKIKLGISSCILGHDVRYNGGNTYNHVIAASLGEYVDFEAVCPEVESGFPTPRPPMRLEDAPKHVDLVIIDSGKKATRRMTSWIKARLRVLEKKDLWGFIFMSRSPSCGVEDVKIFRRDGRILRRGVGLFAEAFLRRFPLVPVEQENRLMDPAIRANFVSKIFVLKRWRDLVKKPRSRRRLRDFHDRHTFVFLERGRSVCERLQEIASSHLPIRTIYALYQDALLAALEGRRSTQKTLAVLKKGCGYLDRHLKGDEKAALLEALKKFKNGAVPLVVPATLMELAIKKYRVSFLERQWFFSPAPLELKFRDL